MPRGTRKPKGAGSGNFTSVEDLKNRLEGLKTMPSGSIRYSELVLKRVNQILSDWEMKS